MLHTLADNLEIVWGALLAAAIVVLLTPAVGGMARLLGVVDRPEGRRLNRRTVPRLGGLALFFGIFVPALAFLDLSGETRGLLLGAAVATTVGAVDDFRGLNWWEKLGGQVAAAAIPVGFGIWVHRFTFPIVGVHTLPKWLGMPLSVLWIVAIMNVHRPYVNASLPDPGDARQYVALDLTIQNQGSLRPTLRSAKVFSLGDSDGKVDPVVAVPGRPNGLDGPFPPGTTRSGQLVFNVPARAQLRMAMDGPLIGTQRAIFLVDPPNLGPGE